MSNQPKSGIPPALPIKSIQMMEGLVRAAQLIQEPQLDKTTALLMIAITIPEEQLMEDVRLSSKFPHQPPWLLHQHVDQEKDYLMIDQDAFNVSPTQELKIGIQFVLQMVAYLLSSSFPMELVEDAQRVTTL
jgi:hypothetical protein